MNTSSGENEELGYVSSSEARRSPNTSKTDEVDLPILERLQAATVDLIVHYSTVDSLDVNDKNFTIEQQLVINQEIKRAYVAFSEMINVALEEAEERRNGNG